MFLLLFFFLYRYIINCAYKQIMKQEELRYIIIVFEIVFYTGLMRLCSYGIGIIVL